MTQARDFWERAVKANLSAKLDFDGAASRAYHAAFYAVSALFALEGKAFKRHATIESAVHNDLVKTGRWPVDLGKAYSFLRETRTTGDYGGDLRIRGRCPKSVDICPSHFGSGAQEKSRNLPCGTGEIVLI